MAKVEGGKVTRYFGGGYELEDDSVIRKYISAGDRRIAMRETTVAGGSAARWPDELAPVVVAAAPGGVVVFQVRDDSYGDDSGPQ